MGQITIFIEIGRLATKRSMEELDHMRTKLHFLSSPVLSADTGWLNNNTNKSFEFSLLRFLSFFFSFAYADYANLSFRLFVGFNECTDGSKLVIAYIF